MNTYTHEEVSTHNTVDDAWIIIDNSVYDITFFLNEHPGGKHILLQFAGTDATEYFNELHQSHIIDEYGEQYKIGIIN